MGIYVVSAQTMEWGELMGLFNLLFGKPRRAQRGEPARNVESCPVYEAPDDTDERERLDEESFLADMYYMDDWAYDDYQQQLKEQEDFERRMWEEEEARQRRLQDEDDGFW